MLHRLLVRYHRWRLGLYGPRCRECGKPWMDHTHYFGLTWTLKDGCPDRGYRPRV